MSGDSERPVGARPEEGRSDWTEQDLLTLDEALPRLDSAIQEVQAELDAATDPDTRTALSDRLVAMNHARENFRPR